LEQLKELKEQCRELFHERCVVCGRYSRIVHEIIPRSHGKVAINLDNMVVLCSEHHNRVHHHGGLAGVLKLYREEAIKRYANNPKL
jgi:5-methylcytosine-specific restriction endonuclease McrA